MPTLQHAAEACSAAAAAVAHAPLVCSRQSGLPVFAVGNVPVAALARLLETLGAGEGGDTHIVVTGEPGE